MAARLWNKAPFVRLLVAMAAGVVCQRYGQLPLPVILLCFGTCLALLILYSFLSIKWRYKLAVANGLALLLLIASLGSIAVWFQDVRHDSGWFGRRYQAGDFLCVTVEE